MNIALIGYGKMGKAIEIVAQSRGHEIALIITKSNLTDLERINLKNVDVAIDFSIPSAAKKNIMNAINLGIPIISGTTGWQNQISDVEAYCKKKKGSFLYASNFSLGVNLFYELNKKMAEIMRKHDDYAIDIREIHHKEKIDIPSGTAISLAEQIIAKNKYINQWNSNQNFMKNSVNIDSIRKDNVVGTHQINYKSEIDNISIEHKAYSRNGFALGAIISAEWIINKNGCFSMTDVLFSEKH